MSFMSPISDRHILAERLSDLILELIGTAKQATMLDAQVVMLQNCPS